MILGIHEGKVSMKISWLCIIALTCVVAMVAPMSVSAQTAPLGEEYQLLPMDFSKNQLLDGEKVCGCFLWTTLGGIVEPRLRFRFLERGQKEPKTETLRFGAITFISDETREIPTATMTGGDKDHPLYTIRISKKARDAAADCLPPLPPEKKGKINNKSQTLGGAPDFLSAYGGRRR
jgi:hypothetical protein